MPHYVLKIRVQKTKVISYNDCWNVFVACVMAIAETLLKYIGYMNKGINKWMNVSEIEQNYFLGLRIIFNW